MQLKAQKITWRLNQLCVVTYSNIQYSNSDMSLKNLIG